MKRMSTLVLVLVVTALTAQSQETHPTSLEKAEHDALVDLCSQTWFANSHADKCQGVKAEVELRKKQQEEVSERAKADAELKARQEQEAKEKAARAEEENMPKNGKVIVEFAAQGGNGYGAILRPVGVQNTFVVYCNGGSDPNANATCKQLKKAKTYTLVTLTEKSDKTYTVGPGVFGTVQLKDPTNTVKAEILYAVVGGDVAKSFLRLAEQRAVVQKLGLHSGQSQSLVKLLLQKQGFAPWTCTTQMGGTVCFTERQRRVSGKDQITVIFGSVTRRDEDTGVAYVVGRVLTAIGYTPYGVYEAISFGPEPF